MADYRDLQDLETLEQLIFLERRSRLIHYDGSVDLDVLDESDFKSRYRLSKATVETLIEELAPKLDSNVERVGAISTAQKVCTALRFFAEGCVQTTVGDLAQISQPSSSRAINTVADCLADMGHSIIKFPSGIEIVQRFRHIAGFPGIVGTLDCYSCTNQKSWRPTCRAVQKPKRSVQPKYPNVER